MISTESGPRPVEDLAVGDFVLTKSNGEKPIRWIGSKTLDQSGLTGNPHLRPVVITAGALGQGRPSTDLTVSPQHRICVDANKTIQLIFAIDEALVPAKGLVDGEMVKFSDQNEVTYYHLMFDQHEIILSNGAWTESFYPGRQAVGDLEKDARDELFEMFPKLRSGAAASYPAAAPILTVQETRLVNKLNAKEARLLTRALKDRGHVN